MTHTHTAQHPVHPPAGPGTGLRTLAWVCGLLAGPFALGGAFLAWSTHVDGVNAPPDADLSLYGLGYLLAMVSGGVAVMLVLGALAAWLASRRPGGTARAVLIGFVGLAILVTLPAIWFLGIFF
jgi:hypothetical protein